MLFSPHFDHFCLWQNFYQIPPNPLKIKGIARFTADSPHFARDPLGNSSIRREPVCLWGFWWFWIIAVVKHDVNLRQFVYIILGFRCLLLRGMGSSRGGKIGEVFVVGLLRCRTIGELV